MLNAIAKLYYTITEVSKIIGEEQHVLRYWEREFPQLKPQKNRAGNRVYTSKDLAVLRVIQRLLRVERYTVAGAREYLKANDIHAELGATASDASVPVFVQTNGHGETQIAPQPKIPLSEVAAVVRELRSISDELRNASTKLND
jgi:DNA-binding transcriptional MerR regulator